MDRAHGAAHTNRRNHASRGASGLILAALVAGLALPLPALAGAPAVSLVTVGSPVGTTPQNHQNEPAVAMDAHQANILAAGVNDFIDWQPCPEDTATQAGTCRGSNIGVGLSGVYFSFDSGLSWTQPTYTGLTSRDTCRTGWRLAVSRCSLSPYGTRTAVGASRRFPRRPSDHRGPGGRHDL